MADPELGPLLQAMTSINRTALGFTQISPESTVYIERPEHGGAYEVMLHISNTTRRTIAFKKAGNGYRWINEIEGHDGPGPFTMPDVVSRETISITYQTEPLSGVPVGRTVIQYTGDDTNLYKP
jgi:hypothetical protein